MDMDVRSKPAKAFGGSAERQSRCDRSHDQRGRPFTGRIARSDRTHFELNIWRVSISRALAAGGAEARHLTF